MSQTKTKREYKRQLGQFLTPRSIAEKIVACLPLKPDDTVLEPSMGDGSFILPLIEHFITLRQGSLRERLDAVLTENVFGIEIDPDLYQRCLDNITKRWGYCPKHHNLICADFFRHWFTSDDTMPDEGVLFADERRHFDYVIGNPPFGGTIDPSLQDQLDRQFGFRNGLKIKKETYSFFIVKCCDLLQPTGRLLFICSDTFLTISTMRGLRRLLMDGGVTTVRPLPEMFDETSHPMVILDFQKGLTASYVSIQGGTVPYAEIEKTGNLSWTVTSDSACYFTGPRLGDIFVATSGMTIGANDLFLRPIHDDEIEEWYDFEFFDDPITLEKERGRARLGYLSPKKVLDIHAHERAGTTRRNVMIIRRSNPIRIRLPHPDYRYYNKGNGDLLYSAPTHAIYWKDEGDAVLTFKKNGNWYLHGVGGQRYFGCEGLTWQLISTRLNARYLPAGYILDSGAPCAFLRPNVDRDELYFVLGWMLSPLCNQILKTVINHTRNIQSKDFERLPYPFWIGEDQKKQLTRILKILTEQVKQGRKLSYSDPEFIRLGALYNWNK